MVSTSLVRLGAVLALAMPLLAHQAQAQMTVPATADFGRAYVGMGAGVVIPEDLHATFSGVVAGTGDLSFKAGPAFTGSIGYHLTDYLATEGEIGFATFDEDKFSGTIGGVSGSAAIDGRVNTVVGFGSLIVTPLGRAGFSPYIGAGAGFANFDEKVNSIGGIAVNSSSNETDFAANFLAGFDVPVGGRWSVGARYRFIWVNTASTSTSAGVTTKQDDFTAHVITATAKFRF